MEILGIDIGFGFTKAFNGSQAPMFKSIFGEAVDIQFHSNFKSSPMFSTLHVTIDNRSYFVGDYAEKQSNVRQFTLDQERLITDFVKIMALTAAGCSSSERDISTNVVSGLPVAYFKEHHKRFAKLLTGQHKIIYHQPDGTEIHKQIYIEKVRMMPQPLGSFFDILLDENGQIVNEVITGQKVGIIDIGFQTTDYTVFDNLRYIDRGSTTMETGISKFFRVIAGKLQEKSGINVEPFRLYDAVENGIIKMRGQEYDISKIRDSVFSQAADIIAGDADRLWTDEWDIDTIILTGGGSMKLSKYLQPLIPGSVISSDEKTDARLNNVKGYLKYGKYIWDDSSLTLPAAEDKKEKKNGT